MSVSAREGATVAEVLAGLDAGVPLSAPATAARRGGRSPRRLVGLLAPLVLLALWQLSSSLELQPRGILPSPEDVLAAGREFFFGTRIDTLGGVVPFAGAGWGHVGASLSRCLTSWAVAVVVGLLLGLGLGLSRWIADLLDPLANALRAVPLYAWLPLAIVEFGVGERPARVLIFIGALWPVVVATADSVARVPRSHIETARMLGVPRARLWRRVYLPSALPEIVTGLRLSLTLAWTCVIVGELVGTTNGVGAMMNAAREGGQTDQILVGLLVFAVVGFAADRLLRSLARPFTRWSET
jgi:sulfonate transport system permease protein